MSNACVAFPKNNAAKTADGLLENLLASDHSLPTYTHDVSHREDLKEVALQLKPTRHAKHFMLQERSKEQYNFLHFLT